MAVTVDFERIFQFLPGNYIVLLPDAPKFTIVAFNNTRSTETFTRKEHIGRGVFEAFPDNPSDPGANGVAMLTASLEKVMETKRPDQMPVQKYDIPNADGTGFELRYWMSKNVPVLNDNGEVDYIIHHVRDMTAQITAQLREINAKQNFENFFNQANIPFAVLSGREFRFTFANPAYAELMNNRPLEGKTLAEAIPELEGQPFIALLKEVFDTGKSYHGIEIAATAHFKSEPGESTRLFDLSYLPYRNEEDVIEGVLAYAYDVTEQVALRKKAEVNRLNQQAYDLFMQAPIGVCILIGAEYKIVLANGPMLEIMGRDTSIIGLDLIKALPEIQGQEVIQMLGQVIATGNSYYANEYPAVLIRNGQEQNVYVNFAYKPYYDDNGNAVGIIAIAAEVTEQVEARKKIEYAEETARLAIESADLGAYEISLTSDEMVTSPRFREIWGIKNNVTRDKFAESIHPDDRKERVRAHKESLVTGKLFYEARIIWADATVHWVRVKGTVVFDAAKQPVRLLGVIQDITEQRAFTDELERAVKERTKELQKANEQLKYSNDELEQFARVTSHDLQEPLRKIQVFTSRIVSGGELKEESLVYTEKILSAAGRMRGLINDILEYSRFSQVKAKFEAADLKASLQAVVVDFELLIAQKKARVQLDVSGIIDAVPMQLNQLFINLLGNALKFSKADIAPEITITGGKMDHGRKIQYPKLSADRDYYEIRFSDNGIGFDQQYAEQIFTVFQRLNSTSDYSGYGIGLALCSKVVARHEGIIFAESKLGIGTTFTVILPYKHN